MASMKAAEIAPAQLKRPGEHAIAFAVSVVRSKPEGLGIKEYINLLRQHIAKGRRDAALSSTHRHLDRSSYWRAECERVKAELRLAEGETVDLKREIDQLKAKLEAVKLASNTVRKRKKVDEDVIPVPHSPKRVRRDVSPVSNGRETEKEHDFSSLGETGDVFMRALYRTHVALKTRNRTPADVLAHHLISAAKALPKVVRDLVKGRFSGSKTGLSDVRSTLIAASRAVLSLMVGVNRLSHATGGLDVQSHVIYEYVQMFSSLLNVVGEASAAEQSTEVITSTSKTYASRKKGAKVKQADGVSKGDSPILSAITSFLCGILDLLNNNSHAHQQMFEGFAYCVLQRVGARLYTTTFGQPRGISIEDEITNANYPIVTDEQEHGQTSDSASSGEQEMNLRLATIEAPYLIHLLNRIMSAATNHLGSTHLTKTGQSKHGDSRSSMKGVLAQVAKYRLQRTLVNAVYGTEGLEEDHTFLVESLKMPSKPVADISRPKMEEADVREWFGEEVWRLLGWEILAQEGGKMVGDEQR